eukprot:CAMPEP_0113476612 /NCGR_PEP_ID=MMETSP0014_2-20120614/19762_1 /TAXON_ID=2857 /ORGANISM="Nitzschia sp." /LENGTH=937 /DNA_ID=CAMNT_0000369641 /DNA_START=399 /DNA_END=3213 /DNA_ORIENTATION=+ /assembly_acc=CAM_ASM_000159
MAVVDDDGAAVVGGESIPVGAVPGQSSTILSSALTATQSTSRGQFDIERSIVKAVIDQLGAIVSVPIRAVKIIETHLNNGGFGPDGIGASNRDEVFTYLYSLVKSFDYLQLYMGTERGEYFAVVPSEFIYREPGNSGYAVTTESQVQDDATNQYQSLEGSHLQDLYYNLCVDGWDGTRKKCSLDEGSEYIKCIDNCEMVPCPTGGQSSKSNETILCPSYKVEELSAPPDGSSTAFGYIPVSYHCIDGFGRMSQVSGGVVGHREDSSTGVIEVWKDGTCRYRNDEPIKEDVIVGPFPSCQQPKKYPQLSCIADDSSMEASTNAQVCSDAFNGLMGTFSYDPRLRPWYRSTRELQYSNWEAPYTFYSAVLGITYSSPFYRPSAALGGLDAVDGEINDAKVFDGVFAVDFVLEDIDQTLSRDYGSLDDTLVIVFEKAEPHYMIGSSYLADDQNTAGRHIYKDVLSDDPTVPCTMPKEDRPEDENCATLRVKANDLGYSSTLDIVASAAVEQFTSGMVDCDQLSENSISSSDGLFVSGSYFSTCAAFSEHAGSNMDWIVMVIAPTARDLSDVIVPGDPLFATLIVVASIGVIACAFLLSLWLFYRKSRDVLEGDVPFMAAFMAGCIILNLSSFTSLGENTDEMCMFRFWSFNMCFALTLAPLFAKVLRMYRLVGNGLVRAIRRKKIDNWETAFSTLPIIVVQVALLTIFSFFDPPRAQEELHFDGSSPNLSITCGHKTSAFSITQITYDAGLVLTGCILSYLSRNVPSQYGETKELLFGMYNIAFTGLCFVVLTLALDATQSSEYSFRAVAVCWGTVVTSGVFVLPRLFRARIAGGSRRRVMVSGLMESGPKASGDKFQEIGPFSSSRPSRLIRSVMKSEFDIPSGDIEKECSCDSTQENTFTSKNNCSSQSPDTYAEGSVPEENSNMFEEDESCVVGLKG